MDGQALEALGERVVVDDRGAVEGAVVLTAAPDPLGQRADAGGRVGAVERDPLRGQLVRAERLEVADRLGVLEAGEAVGGARDLDVGLGVVDELQEAPGRRAALVQLAGRVQEARAVAEGRRRARGVAHAPSRSSVTAASNFSDGAT